MFISNKMCSKTFLFLVQTNLSFFIRIAHLEFIIKHMQHPSSDRDLAIVRALLKPIRSQRLLFSSFQRLLNSAQ